MKLLIFVILLAAAAVIFLGWDPMGLGLFRGLPGTWIVDREAMEAEEGSNLFLDLVAGVAGGYEKIKLHLADDGTYRLEGVPGEPGGEWKREGEKVTLSGLDAATYSGGRLTVDLSIGKVILKRE